MGPRFLDEALDRPGQLPIRRAHKRGRAKRAMASHSSLGRLTNGLGAPAPHLKRNNFWQPLQRAALRAASASALQETLSSSGLAAAGAKRAKKRNQIEKQLAMLTAGRRTCLCSTHVGHCRSWGGSPRCPIRPQCPLAEGGAGTAAPTALCCVTDGGGNGGGGQSFPFCSIPLPRECRASCAWQVDNKVLPAASDGK